MNKALVRYVHGTPPHAVKFGTQEDLVKFLEQMMDVVDYHGFYSDKKNIRNLGSNLPLFRGPYQKHDYYRIIDGDKWQNKIDKNMLPETNVAASGIKKWYKGAWIIAFIYSNKGNFVMKGYYGEVMDQLKKMDLKYFINITMWNSGTCRNMWMFSADGVYMDVPSKRNKWKWTIRKYKNSVYAELKFKRLPKRWIPEIEEFTKP